MRQKKPEVDEPEEDEFDIHAPTQSINWADDEYEDDPIPVPAREPEPGPPPQASEPVFDLRDKLKAMRLAGGQNGQQQQKAPEPISDTQQFLGSWGQRASTHQKTAAGKLPLPKRNTENFLPSYAPPEMRILAARPGLKHYDRPYSSRDVLVVNDLFCDPDDLVRTTYFYEISVQSHF